MDIGEQQRVIMVEPEPLEFPDPRFEPDEIALPAAEPVEEQQTAS